MNGYILIAGGVRKIQSWGYSEVYGVDAECFTEVEAQKVVLELSALPFESLGERQKALLTDLKSKFSL